MSQVTLRPQKTALLVAQQIVADIQQRGNVAGDRLPPEKVMLEQYQIGRGTLRESLRFLELQGMITLKPGPGGGPVVEQANGTGLATSLTLLLQFENAPYRDIVEARNSVEPAMARLAARRISDEDLVALKKNIDTMGAHLDDEDVFAETNQEFHDIVARASGNHFFAHLIDALTGILDGTSMGVEYPRHRRGPVHEAHVRVYDALAAHDSFAAAEAMRNHIGDYTKYVEKKYADKVNSPISWH